METRRIPLFALALVPLTSALACTDQEPVAPDEAHVRFSLITSSADLTPKQDLGRLIFFDEDLSINGNQSCAACHDPEWGFTGPDPEVNAHGAVYEGSIPGRFGNRKPPSVAYATPSPLLHYVLDKGGVLFVGGNFWDGRATGWRLGNPAAEQALGPFLNPLEQALPDAACVVYRVCTAPYGSTFEDVWGLGACAISWPANVETVCATEWSVVALSDEDRAKVSEAYDNIGLSVAAYEGSPEVNRYSSKYDAYLAGAADLSWEERFGLQMFKAKGRCAACHVLGPGPNGEPPLFTDFTFDNLGVPRNPQNPFYANAEFNPAGEAWVDQGLGGFLASVDDFKAFSQENMGKQKVPTVRNVDLRPASGGAKAYTHNGYFKTLEGLVHFYNTRDVKPTCPGPYTEAEALAAGCWPAAEVPENVNTSELGDLHLTPAQEAAIVAFLKTLSDGYF